MYCEIEIDKPSSTGAALTRCNESITATMAPNDSDNSILKQIDTKHQKSSALSNPGCASTFSGVTHLLIKNSSSPYASGWQCHICWVQHRKYNKKI